jgi:hypothetical protein
MNTYLIKWPDGTISILTASCDFNLWWDADREGDVLDSRVRIYELPEDFQLGTFINKKGKIEVNVIYPCKPLKRYRLNSKTLTP